MGTPTTTNPARANHLYFLVEKGTSIRITDKGGDPILVERDYLQDVRDRYEHIIGRPLVPMTIQDWMDRFKTPVHQARKDAAHDPTPDELRRAEREDEDDG